MNEEELQLYKYLNGLISYPFTRDSRNKILEMFSDVLKQNEAYKKVIKEAIEFVKKYQRKDGFLNLNEWQTRDLLNILNKIGSDK